MDIIGKTYETNNYGTVTVLTKIPPSKSGRTISLYEVRFSSTGNIELVTKDNLKHGCVADKKAIKIHPMVGKRMRSNGFGWFTVLRHIPKKYMTLFEVEFEATGYKKEVQLGAIQKREIRDPYFPVKYGVACMGGSKKKSHLYSRWSCMISRCYNKGDVAYHRYGGSGIIVCDSWLCFENFERDARSVPGYDEQMIRNNQLQLDKDKSGMKIYSLKSCEWITPKENQRYKRPRHSVREAAL